MLARKLKIFFLLLAGLVAFATTVLPHHHHDDGAICLLIPDGHHHDADDDSDDCCGDDCLQRMNTVDALTLNPFHALRFAPVRLLQGAWDDFADALLSGAAEEPSCRHGLYIERLHASVFLKTLGLRAPPVG